MGERYKISFEAEYDNGSILVGLLENPKEPQDIVAIRLSKPGEGLNVDLTVDEAFMLLHGLFRAVSYWFAQAAAQVREVDLGES